MNVKIHSKSELIKKYNVPGPRYTSYPTVPYWDSENFTSQEWTKQVSESFKVANCKEGISLYIHLPYCESLCTYCGCNTRITVNHLVEIPYIKVVLEEWKMYKRIFGRNLKIKEIHLGGGTPTFFSPENLSGLIEGILCNSIIQEGAEFGFEAHPNNTTIEHLKMLYELGFKRLSLGIQDFDSKVQEVVNRKQSYEQVKNLTFLAREIGYTSINFDLIYGLPSQNLSSIVDTIKKVTILKPDRISFYSYAHIPWIKPGQRKFTEEDLPKDEIKRQLYETGRRMLEEVGYREIGMDHFALPSDSLYKALVDGTLHRNFMGYTSCHTSTLIGLGCSAISDTWTAFAQNIKTVENYIREVKNGHLPLLKGHILTNEDIRLRKHILNIMCRMETSWEEASLPLMDGIIKRLASMQADGLLTISKNNIKIIDACRPFIRNACMAFDEKLYIKKTESTIFSKVI